MQFDDWRHTSLLIEGKRYFVRAKGRGRWILEESGISIAGSQRQGTGPRLTLTVSFDTRSWLLKPRRKGLILHHDIWEDDCVVGHIAKTIGWWRKAAFYTPEELIPRTPFSGEVGSNRPLVRIADYTAK